MQITFEAVLETLPAEMVWVVARLPFDPRELDPSGAWPSDNKLRVKGSIRAAHSQKEPFCFSTTLFHSRERGYLLLVTQKMRKPARLTPGAMAEIVLEPDLEGLAGMPPPELAKFLRSERGAKKWYMGLNYSIRKYIAGMISEPKSAEVRVRRAEQWMERILLAMEGEESPPPILQIAFRRQPRARAGWDAMTANQRRWTLLSIFTCVSPEAKQKRVEQAMANAMKAANRQPRGKTASNSISPAKFETEEEAEG